MEIVQTQDGKSLLPRIDRVFYTLNKNRHIPEGYSLKIKNSLNVETLPDGGPIFVKLFFVVKVRFLPVPRL